MIYPKEFQEKVRKVYANNELIIKNLETGSAVLGKHLYDNRMHGVPNEQALNATSLEEVQSIAKRTKQTVELYSEWFVLFQEQVLDKENKVEAVKEDR